MRLEIRSRAGLHLEGEREILLVLRRILLPSPQQHQFLTGLNQVA